MSEFIRPCVKTAIPGENAKKVIALDNQYMMTVTKASPLAIKQAKGIVLEDVDGNIFYDFTSGVGVINTGHCHPKIVKAIQDQAEKLMHFAGTDYYYEVQSLLVEKLAKIAPGKHGKKVFLTNSGSESVEAALKLARFYTKRPQFLAFMGAFHGRTMGALSLTCSKALHKKGFQPTMPGVIHIPYGYCYRCPYHLQHPSCDIFCVKFLEETYFRQMVDPTEMAAMFIEPIQGEGGYIVPPKEFIQALKRICEKYGILYVSDEVQAGFGRTGKFFAIENYDVVPDIITAAKGMGSGLPIGCIIVDEKLDYPYSGAHSNTYGGNAVCCASTLATMDVLINDGVMNNAKVVGDYLHQKLLELQNKHSLIGDVRGIGLMQGIELVKDRTTKEFAKVERDRFIEEMLKLGLVCIGCGVSSVRFIPPLIITKQEIDVAVEIMDKALTIVENGK
ncbi:acetyl ornithine aminotransferase family protein [bacterium]|nr:acetyl ornithine aminotransferase family protein [bacterium]